MTNEILPPVLQRAKDLGFAVFLKGAYNVNIIGVRSRNTSPNLFSDKIYVFYRETSVGSIKEFSADATTHPGLFWLNNPERKDGTAIVAADMQYRSCWAIGEHKAGQPDAYPALVQVGPIAVYRDANKNNVLDFIGKPIPGIYGIQLHHASLYHKSTSVDKWSAGCQVIADPKEHIALMDLCRLSVKNGNSKFSYTLLNEWR